MSMRVWLSSFEPLVRAEQVFQAGGCIPAFGEGEFGAGRAKPIDHLDGDDLCGADGFFAARDVLIDDLIKAEQLPERVGQPDVAEVAAIGPGDLVEPDTNDVLFVGGGWGVVGEETKLLEFSLAIVEEDRALPALFLVAVEVAEVSDDALSGTCVGADALDDGEVGMGLAVLGSGIASQEHLGLPAATMTGIQNKIK